MKAEVPVVVVATGIARAPLAQADPNQADLSPPFSVAGGPYVGEWRAHGEALTINGDGSAVETSRMGTQNFRFNTTAYGNLPNGGYATATLVDDGRGLTLNVAVGDNGFPFCKMVNGSSLNSFD